MNQRTFLTTILLLAAALCCSSSARARSVTLEQAYRLALEHNPAIETLAQRVQQAESARRAAWAALKPTAGFQGSYTIFDQEIALDFSRMAPPGVDLPAEPIVIQEQDQFAFALQATLPLFRGPAYPRIGLARKQVELAQQQRTRGVQEFLLQVARAYYGLLGQQDAIGALQTKVGVDRRNLDAARARFGVGRTPRSDVLRADLVLTQDEQLLRRQRILLDAGKQELAILIGLPGMVDVTRPAEVAPPRGSTVQMVQAALDERADLAAARTAVRAREQGKDAVWWGFAPSLDLSWLYRWQESAGFAGKRGAWQLVFGLSLPIYDGGLRYAQLHEADAALAASRAELRNLSQGVQREVVRLRAELVAADAGLVAAGKAVSLARTTAEDMTVRYEAGDTTQLDVLDAAQRQLEAELELTRSRYVRELARLALAHALGRFDPVRPPR